MTPTQHRDELARTLAEVTEDRDLQRTLVAGMKAERDEARGYLRDMATSLAARPVGAMDLVVRSMMQTEERPKHIAVATMVSYIGQLEACIRRSGVAPVYVPAAATKETKP